MRTPLSPTLCALGLFALLLSATSAGAETLKTFHAFAPRDGESNPSAGVILGGDGNFYGTTTDSSSVSGTLPGCGAVFRLTPSGELTTLYRFGMKANDGAVPHAQLVEGSDGNFYGTTVYTSFSNGKGLGAGTVFKITPMGKLTTLYRFGKTANDGRFPEGSLAEGNDGNFYGTTYYTAPGATPGNGTVFQITPAGVLTTIYTFGMSATDGASPYAGLVKGVDGNFYGTTVYRTSVDGVFTGAGTIFQITPAGVLTTLHVFGANAYFGESPPPTDGAGPYGGLVQGTDGNFYGTTTYAYFRYAGFTYGGSGSGAGTVFRISPSGTFLTIYNFGEIFFSGEVTTDGAYPEATLIQGGDGEFYGTTVRTGAFDRGSGADGTIFKISSDGLLQTLYRFGTSATDGATPKCSLVEGLDGNFYGTTPSGGASGRGNVFELVSPAIVVGAVSDVSSSGGTSQVTLNGTVNPKGRPTSVHFQFGQTREYGDATVPASIGAGKIPVSVSASLTSLPPNTTYHYRIVAKSSAGSETSADQLLVTTNAGSLTFTANDDTAIVTGRAPVKINVLANDTGPDGISPLLSAVTQPAYGRVAIESDGMIIYTPRINFAKFGGTDTFTYTIDFGSTATVTVSN
jgi:uncharacterized repeat protein (TIGR03803 family)